MTGLAVLAATLAVYSLAAGRLDRWSISAPMVFELVGTAIGSSGLELLHEQPDSEIVRGVAELTLAVLLFADPPQSLCATSKGTSACPGGSSASGCR